MLYYFTIIPIDLFYSLPKDAQKSVILTTAGIVCLCVCVCLCVYVFVCMCVCVCVCVYAYV